MPSEQSTDRIFFLTKWRNLFNIFLRKLPKNANVSEVKFNEGSLLVSFGGFDDRGKLDLKMLLIEVDVSQLRPVTISE